MDKMYQWCIWENVRKAWLFPNLFYPYSIVNSTPLFQNHCKQQPFLFIPTDYRSGREKLLMALLLKQMRPWRLEKRDRQLLMLLWTACFCLFLKKARWGQRRRKKGKNESFFTKAICKILALGGEQLLWIREQHRVAELKLSGPLPD